MTDVDAALAGDRYTTWSGWTWFKCGSCIEGGGWWLPHRGRVRRKEDWHLTPAQMRLLIVRDMHRVTCPGLIECYTDHPVPVVLISRGVEGLYFEATADSEEDTQVCTTLVAALDAARRMTGEQK